MSHQYLNEKIHNKKFSYSLYFLLIFPNNQTYLRPKKSKKKNYCTLNIKTHGTLMVQGTSQIALIYRVYYKCMRTNMNVGALNRSGKSETTLIQTTDPKAKVSIPRCLKWNEITFPADWTLENDHTTDPWGSGYWALKPDKCGR